MALVKATTTVVTDPGRPGVPSKPGRGFSLIGTPPPKGYMYNTPLPTTMPAFAAWKQIIPMPNTQVTAPLYIFRISNTVFQTDSEGRFVVRNGTKYYVSEALLKIGADEFANAYVLSLVTTDGLGNRVPPAGYEFAIVGRRSDAPATQWAAAPSGMEYVQMHNPRSPNGYPLKEYDAPRDYDLTGTFYVGSTEYVWPMVRINGNGILGFANNLFVPDATCRLSVLALESIPATPAIPAVPPTKVKSFNEGWNAGANSVQRLDGNVQVTFEVDIKSLGAVGFARPGTVPAGQYQKIDHAIYFSMGAHGSLTFQAMERGRLVGPLMDPNDSEAIAQPSFKYRIKRERGIVSYWVIEEGSPEFEFYRSMVPSTGEVMVTAALYRGEDGVI